MSKNFLLTVMLVSITNSTVYCAELNSSYQLNFKDEFRVDRTDSIELWEQPKNKYTPGNLVSQQQMRIQGYNSKEKNFQSYTVPFTDYDTKIIETYQKDGYYYTKDNTGKVFRTGISESQVNSLGNKVNQIDNRVSDIENKMEAGLATVTALTSLHPNPRAKGRTQIAIGSGVYKDNVAGAVGIFHHIKDNIMISGGAAYGGDSDWAGNVGITFSFE